MRRRDLKPRPMTATARKLLQAARESQKDTLTPAELIRASGIRPAWAWNALATLVELRLVRMDAKAGTITLTRAGVEASRRAAA